MDHQPRLLSEPEPIAAEISRLALTSLRASGAFFYWIDPSRTMADVSLVGIAPRFYHDYLGRMEAVDPSNISRMTAAGHSLTHLRRADHPLTEHAATYARFLSGYGVADVLDLMFWSEGVAVAGIGILKRDEDPATCAETLATASAMQRFIEFTLRKDPRLGRARRRRAMTQRFQLTMREAEVAELVFAGLTNAEIAGALDMRLPTVKSHLLQVFAKSGCTTRTKLAAELHRLD